MTKTDKDRETPHIPPRVGGPNYLITETDDRFWWRPEDQRPVYITPAHWWDR